MEPNKDSIRPSRRRTLGLPARLRLTLHHRRTRPVAVVILVAVAVMIVRGEHQQIAAAEAAWGEHRPAWVAAHDIDAGHLLREGDVVARGLPPAALPVDAVVESPVGLRLSDDIVAGEIMRAGRLGGDTSSETASQVDSGQGAVLLSALAPHLEPGDTVELYALLSGELVATNARVIRIVDGQPVVAVDLESLPDVILAFTTGDVVPVLVG